MSDLRYDSTDSIRVRIASVQVDPLAALPLVILEDEVGSAIVPIRVGAGEASAIAAELDAIDFIRPTTHQLMGDILASAGIRVVSVVIDVIGEGSFFGVLDLELPSGERVRKEARASDALALAQRAAAEIRVTRAVIQDAARHESAEEGAGAAVPARAEGAPAPLSASQDEGAWGPATDGERPGKWKV